MGRKVIMAFNIRSIMGRNTRQPQQELPPLPGGPPPRSPQQGFDRNKPLPPPPTLGKSSPAPEIPRTRSGRVDVPYEKRDRSHLSAMADDQLVQHWQQTSTDPTTQQKGMGGPDVNDSRVQDAMGELNKRKIDPFQTTGPSSKGNKFDDTGKMDAKFYQANKDPKTGAIIHTGKKGAGGNMEKTTGKGRIDPRRNSPPPSKY
jgi:hypothetical protein